MCDDPAYKLFTVAYLPTLVYLDFRLIDADTVRIYQVVFQYLLNYSIVVVSFSQILLSYFFNSFNAFHGNDIDVLNVNILYLLVVVYFGRRRCYMLPPLDP